MMMIRMGFFFVNVPAYFSVECKRVDDDNIKGQEEREAHENALKIVVCFNCWYD